MADRLAHMDLARAELERRWILEEDADESEEDTDPRSGWVPVFDHVTPTQWKIMSESDRFEEVGVLSDYLTYYASTQSFSLLTHRTPQCG